MPILNLVNECGRIQYGTGTTIKHASICYLKAAVSKLMEFIRLTICDLFSSNPYLCYVNRFKFIAHYLWRGQYRW